MPSSFNRVPIHHLIDPIPNSEPTSISPPTNDRQPTHQHHDTRRHLPVTLEPSPATYRSSSPSSYRSPRSPAPPVNFSSPFNFEENGRVYYGYKSSMYPYPVDEAEGSRLDQLHYMIYDMLLDQRLHVANLRQVENNNNFRILDVGFGTSLWAQHVSTQYPHAQVVGIDLKGFIMENQRQTFPNLDLRNGIDFTEEDWGLKENSFDFIHLGLLAGSVPDWPALYRKCFKYLKPGVGQLEYVELDLSPRHHSQSSPPAAGALQHYWTCLSLASTEAGLPIQYRSDTDVLLAQAGFINPADTRFRIALVDHGQTDEHTRGVARWFQAAMMHEWTIDSYQGLAMALLTRQLGWSRRQVDDLCRDVLDGVRSTQGELYHNLHVWTAKKPAR